MKTSPLKREEASIECAPESSLDELSRRMGYVEKRRTSRSGGLKVRPKLRNQEMADGDAVPSVPLTRLQITEVIQTSARELASKRGLATSEEKYRKKI